MKNTEGFQGFSLSEAVLQAVESKGFTTPSPIQTAVIPLILSGADVVGQAQTGTGKTAAYGLPSISMIEANKSSMLVITPTRELALQVSQELHSYGKFARIKTATVYGGSSFSKQIEDIRKGAQVVVATPGRLLDLLSSKRLGNFAPSIVVLDEADEMLNMGFLEDVQSIFEYLPESRQTLLFSATLSQQIQKLIKKILKDPQFVKVTAEETTNKDIEQQFYIVEEKERELALLRLIDTHSPHKAVIFCRTRRDADGLTDALAKRDHLARALHGDIEQRKREEVIGQFRSGAVRYLVATDVAARGLNVPDISHVFNFHMPYDAESYVHRIGRTARAGREGIAMSLVSPREARDIRRIENQMGTHIKQHSIPSKAEVASLNATRLANTVRTQTAVVEQAKEVLKLLRNDMGLEEVAERLVSSLLLKQDVAGPERIGMSKEQFESFGSGNRSSHAPRGDSRDRNGRRGPPRHSFKGPRRDARSDARPAFEKRGDAAPAGQRRERKEFPAFKRFAKSGPRPKSKA